MSAIRSEQRYSKRNPCPHCGQFPNDPRGDCHGWLSEDGEWTTCDKDHGDGAMLIEKGIKPVYLYRRNESGIGYRPWTPEKPTPIRSARRAHAPAPPKAHTSEPGVRYFDYTNKQRIKRVDSISAEGGPDKFCIPEHLLGGRWQTGDGPGEIEYIYRRAEIADRPDELLHVFEGETCAEAGAALGLRAMTWRGGTGRVNQAIEQIKAVCTNEHVVLHKDSDQPGRKAMKQIAAAIAPVVKSLRMIDYFPDEHPDHGGRDIQDWLAEGGNADDLLQLIADAAEFEPGTDDHEQDEPVPVRPSGMTLRELMAKKFAERRSVVGEMILASSVTFLAARAKIGNTWQMCGLALSVALGGRALGKIPVDKRDVLAIHCEDGEQRLQDRFEKLLCGAEPPANLHIFTEWPRFDEGGIEQLDTALAANPAIGFVLIDTIAAVRPRRKRGADLVEEDYAVGKPLKALAEKYGVAILASVHTRKAAAEDFVDTISGTGGMSAGVDNILVMQRIRGQSAVTLHATGRDIREEEYALTFDAITGQFVIAGDAAEFTLSKERQDILNTLRTADGPLNPVSVAETLGKNPNTTRNLMWKMTEAGTIFTDGGGGTYTHKRSTTVNGVNAVNIVNGINTVNADANPVHEPAQQRLRTPHSVYGEDQSVNAVRDGKPSDSKENDGSVYGVYGVYGVGEERVNADAPTDPEEIAWTWIAAVKSERTYEMPDAVCAAAVRLGCALDRFRSVEDEASRLADYLDHRAVLKGGG